ncbi:unnamed protein product [Spirodela intermedia]|uniref:Uncharacterized protein n=2 Tax=Spirodela intermedia TaxID=51605 RepID=A0A7I8I8G2_SPIIN|nr:unnamed protein product [Spirodela intermedia]CAA6653935.1 unnamed protein product [Spirodela intermedia]CAA7388371.1 unnamed protein product [Spirodela intermedia]
MLPARAALSREAKVRISAQETTPGHAASMASLAASITSRPRRVKLGIASFSDWLSGVESRSTEASHPCDC